MTFESLQDLLQSHGQEGLLQFYSQLSSEEQDSLREQIESVDWDMLKLIQHRGKPVGKGKLEPLGALELPEIEKQRSSFTKAGLEAIQAGQIGAVLLAGGQGTRLGYDGPKGTVNIGLTKTLYIFQCLIHNLMEVVQQAGAWIHLFIMTSPKNHRDTVSFFEEHSFFGYSPEHVHFFKQEMAPSVDFGGKILLEGKGQLSLSPNGNGGWFSSMAKAGLLPFLHEKGIQWLNVFAVDNVLQRIADPCFIGATLSTGHVCGSEVVRKASPTERVGVLCLEDGKPSIVEYYEMTNDMIHLKNENGDLLYNFGVILNYLFRVDKLEEILGEKMPVHVVEKKIPYMYPQGNLIKPEAPNGFKFELLVLDMIHLMDNCLSFEVERCREFAPIKNREGVDSVESARKLLQENGVEL